MSSEQMQSALSALQKRAASDEAFRELAKTDPHAALKEVGANVPSTAKVKFIEPEEGVVITLLPKESSDGALSDEQLETAAGGTWMYTMQMGCWD